MFHLQPSVILIHQLELNAFTSKCRFSKETKMCFNILKPCLRAPEIKKKPPQNLATFHLHPRVSIDPHQSELKKLHGWKSSRTSKRSPVCLYWSFWDSSDPDEWESKQILLLLNHFSESCLKKSDCNSYNHPSSLTFTFIFLKLAVDSSFSYLFLGSDVKGTDSDPGLLSRNRKMFLKKLIMKKLKRTEEDSTGFFGHILIRDTVFTW